MKILKVIGLIFAAIFVYVVILSPTNTKQSAAYNQLRQAEAFCKDARNDTGRGYDAVTSRMICDNMIMEAKQNIQKARKQ